LARVTAPLSRITGKRKLEWSSELQLAFDNTKSPFEKINTLAIPDPDANYILETDVSFVGLGAVLLQERDGVEKPVGYFSKALSDAESRYPAYKLELFGLFRSIKHFGPYLSFLKHFIVRTANQALRYWRTADFAPGNPCAKWKSFLSVFCFDIEHVSGTSNSLADAISRAPQLVHSTPTLACHSREEQSVPQKFSGISRAAKTSVGVSVTSLKPVYNDDHQLLIGVMNGGDGVSHETIRAGTRELKELFSHRHQLKLQDGLIVRVKDAQQQLYVPAVQRDDLLRVTNATAHQSAEKMLAALKDKF